jgi:hypothetical protein
MAYSIEELKHMLEPFAERFAVMPPRQFVQGVQQAVLVYLMDDEELTVKERLDISVEVANWMVEKGEEYVRNQGNNNSSVGSGEKHS